MKPQEILRAQFSTEIELILRPMPDLCRNLSRFVSNLRVFLEQKSLSVG